MRFVTRKSVLIELAYSVRLAKISKLFCVYISSLSNLILIYLQKTSRKKESNLLFINQRRYLRVYYRSILQRNAYLLLIGHCYIPVQSISSNNFLWPHHQLNYFFLPNLSLVRLFPCANLAVVIAVVVI